MTNNSRESLDDDISQSRANIHAGPPLGGHMHTDNPTQQRMNTSEIMHSRLGLLDNQVTVNYDLSHMTLPKGEGAEVKSKKKVKGRDKFAIDNNFTQLPQNQLEKEIEFEQNVDLEKTMWKVLRNKKSVNNILKRFETKGQIHSLIVNDLVKFGRVNFKVSVIKIDKVRKAS